jgi:hypothetical protein
MRRIETLGAPRFSQNAGSLTVWHRAAAEPAPERAHHPTNGIWGSNMSTTPTKILTAFAVAAAVVAGSLAVSSTADARTYRHHHYSYYRPYVFHPGYWRAPYYYGRAYAYRPGYPRIPIYNHDDATKLDR